MTYNGLDYQHLPQMCRQIAKKRLGVAKIAPESHIALTANALSLGLTLLKKKGDIVSQQSRASIL